MTRSAVLMASLGFMNAWRTRFSEVPASEAVTPERVIVAMAAPTSWIGTLAAAAEPTTSPMTPVSSENETTPRLTVWKRMSLTREASEDSRPYALRTAVTAFAASAVVARPADAAFAEASSTSSPSAPWNPEEAMS